MTTAVMFKTDPATRRTMKCMLIAFGLLLNAPASRRPIANCRKLTRRVWISPRGLLET